MQSITLSNMGHTGLGIAGATALGFIIVVSGPPKPAIPPADGGGAGIDHVAASCSAAHVQAMLNELDEGETGMIPAGTCHWTTGVTADFTSAPNVTIIGARSLSTTGGGDTTVIIDDIASDARIMSFAVARTGTFRFAGITVQGGSGVAKDQTSMFYVGGPGAVRIDHSHFNTHTYDTSVQHKIWWIGNKVYGVMDHTIIDAHGASANYVYNGMGADGQGNITWTEPTNFGNLGGSEYFYFEDNIYSSLRGGYLAIRGADLFSAGKAVFRFNTVNGGSGMEGHHTGHSHDDRGARSMEHYGNQYNAMSGLGGSGVAGTMADARGGTSLVWGNAMGTDAITNGITLGPPTRDNFGTYPILAEPAGYGFCNAPYKTGTASVAANGVSVTKTGGDNFDTGWPQYAVLYLTGVGRYYIDSVSSTTTLTLNGVGAGGSASGTWIVGSKWDGNAGVHGYPCLDQAGRGPGQLLTGSFGVGGGKLNAATGTRAWPNQALEPVYVWKNTGSPTTNYYVQGYQVVAERDFYPQASGIQTTSSSPFDGTTGTGWGIKTRMPATCTTGVGYFATDEGSWNTSSSNPHGVQQSGADGRLYKCTATNTWTLYYTPLTYPHPLQGAP